MDIIASIKKFNDNAKHVMSISYKPNRPEFERAGKLIIFGIVLVGVLGFIIAIAISLIITGSLSLI